MSVLEMDTVCKFNSNVTSYNDRNASFKIALSVRMEALVFVRAIMCRHPCFMTLALPRVASGIMGGSLFLANKREASSHSSLFWVINITVFTGEKTVTDFYNVICIQIVYLLNLVEDGFFGIAFVDALTHAFAFLIAPEKVFLRWIAVLCNVARRHRSWDPHLVPTSLSVIAIVSSR